jgi:hypothetical protein
VALCKSPTLLAISPTGSQTLKFRRDGWARPWPVGVEMLCYMLSHEDHHREQVCMLAHQLGFPPPDEVKVGFVSGFVADDLPAASYNERSCLSYRCVERLRTLWGNLAVGGPWRNNGSGCLTCPVHT